MLVGAWWVVGSTGPLDGWLTWSRFTGRSLAAFKRDFQQFSPLSPGRWVTQKRLEVAHDLLSSTQLSATDVAYKVGFKNISHFSTAFKHRYGVAPTQL